MKPINNMAVEAIVVDQNGKIITAYELRESDEDISELAIEIYESILRGDENDV